MWQETKYEGDGWVLIVADWGKLKEHHVATYRASPSEKLDGLDRKRYLDGKNSICNRLPTRLCLPFFFPMFYASYSIFELFYLAISYIIS